MKTYRQILESSDELKDNDVNEDRFMNAVFNWTMHNKKFKTFNKMFSEEFGYFRNAKEYAAAGGKLHAQNWSVIVGKHITDEGAIDTYWYGRKDVVKFWKKFSKKVKVTIDDIEEFEQKWHRTIYNN